MPVKNNLSKLGITLLLALSLSITSQSILAKTTVVPKGSDTNNNNNSGAEKFDTKDQTENATSTNIGEMEAELTKIRGSKGKPDAEAKALFNLAKAYGEARQFEKAESFYRQALAIDKKSGKPSDIFQDYQSIAVVQSLADQFSKAEATYLEALADAKTNKNDQWIVTFSNNLGSLCLSFKQLEKAEVYYKQARDTAAGVSDYAGEAKARLNLGLLYQKSGQAAKGITEVEAAQKLLGANLEDQALVGRIASNLAALKERTGNLDGALSDYKNAAHAFELAGEDDQQGTALISVGSQLLMRGQAKEAISTLETAVDIFKSQENFGRLAQALSRLGAAQADCGQFEEAQRSHTDAANYAYKSKRIDDYINALYELAYDQYLAGNLDGALNKFVEVSAKVKAEPKLADKDAAADCDNSIALCYRGLGQAEAAVQFYQKAADGYRSSKNKVGEISAENSIACVYIDRQIKDADYILQYKKVAGLIESASADVKESREFKRLVGFIDYNNAQYLLTQDQFAPAQSGFEKALNDFTASGDRKGQARTYVGLGLCKLLQGTRTNNKTDFEQAILFYKKAEPLAKELALTETQWDCSIGQGTAYKGIGDAAQAEAMLKRAIALFEKEKGQYSRDDSKTFTLDLRGGAFEELVALLFEQKRYDEALEIAERGRARSFLDLLEGRSQTAFVRQNAPVSTAPVKASPAPANTTNSTASAPVTMPKIAMVGEKMRNVQVVPRDLSSIDSAHGLALETALSPVNAKAPDLKELKALVQASKGYVLEYFAGRDQLYIWLINPQGEVLAATSPITHSQLIKKVTEAYQAIITPPKTITDLVASNQRRQQNLIDLYKILIDPIKDKLPKTAEEVITVVPQAELFKVPFAALTDASGHLLIEDHTLAVVPSIGVFRATQKLAAELPAGEDQLFAFGNPKIKILSVLGALPYSEKEVKKISELFGAEHSFVRIGTEATKKTLREFAPKASVIHLATHGLIDEDRPMDSAVLLATTDDDDGILSVKDILQLPTLKAKLVTLSACQTGRGKITGDGVAGLSRAFIIAGTPSVLVTLWNVDDVMTEYQMEAFYGDYLKGAHKARALRDAQLKTIAFMEKGLVMPGSTAGGVKIRANPRYWAAFQLIGDSQ